MKVTFRTKKLERCFLKSSQAFREYGDQVGKRYIQRINIIKAARNLDELVALRALRCHPLKGNRDGQYAVNLTGFQRLIFTLEGDELSVVMIEEVSKHYDD